MRNYTQTGFSATGHLVAVTLFTAITDSLFVVFWVLTQLVLDWYLSSLSLSPAIQLIGQIVIGLVTFSLVFSYIISDIRMIVARARLTFEEQPEDVTQYVESLIREFNADEEYDAIQSREYQT